jgi:hypothetical protein
MKGVKGGVFKNTAYYVVFYVLRFIGIYAILYTET